MEVLFQDKNKTNDDGKGKENGKKWFVYILKQTTTLHVHHAIL